MKSFLFLLCVACPAIAHAQTCVDTTVYSGTATYYNYSGGGNCSFPVPAAPIYTAAMNAQQYDTAATCGACLEVTGALGTVIVSVEDQCPSCAVNNLDLSEEAFAQIDSLPNGITAIQWKFTGCPVVGNISMFISNATNPYYINMQVRNHRYPVKTVEFKSDGSQYVTMQRGSDNMFVVTPPVMPATAPLSFRITDVLGNVIEETNVPFTTGTPIAGSSQFPQCIANTVAETIPVAEALVVSPNPSSGKVKLQNLSKQQAQFAVYNVAGKVLHQGRITALDATEFYIQEKGLFLIRASVAGGKELTRALVIY